MKTSASTPTNTNFELKEAFALWEKNKGELTYYSGKTAGDNPINIVGFVTETKKNPNQPDLKVYESGEKDKEKIEIASLWKQTSKAGKEYYSGSTNEKEKIIAFINGDTKDGKYPSIRVYFKDVK